MLWVTSCGWHAVGDILWVTSCGCILWVTCIILWTTNWYSVFPTGYRLLPTGYTHRISPTTSTLNLLFPEGTGKDDFDFEEWDYWRGGGSQRSRKDQQSDGYSEVKRVKRFEDKPIGLGVFTTRRLEKKKIYFYGGEFIWLTKLPLTSRREEITRCALTTEITLSHQLM